MTLTGNIVRFRLSPEGRAALPQFPTEAFEAEVLHEDELGVWISAAGGSGQPIRAVLLKWHYFPTAEVDFPPGPPETRARAGFR
jgi:hypothetical protein